MTIESKAVIAIHGGAGTISRSRAGSAAQEAAYHEALNGISPSVADSGEGRWTAIEAIELGIPAPVMSLALMSRFASQGHDEYASKLLAMMRKGFGGHAVAKEVKK